MAKLKGTILNADGAPACRLVRAHRKFDGSLSGEVLSDRTTGSFEVTTPDQTKHYLVVHAQEGWLTYLPCDLPAGTVVDEWSGKTLVLLGGTNITAAQFPPLTGATTALALDGTTADGISTQANPDFAFGTMDFTVAGWVHPSLFGTDRPLFDTRAAAGDAGLYFAANAGGYVFASSGGVNILVASAALQPDVWQHVALVRIGGVVSLYVSGQPVASATFTGALQAPGIVRIGRGYSPTSNSFSGYIGEFEILKGYARWVGPFNVPTNPRFVSQDGDEHVDSVVLACHFHQADTPQFRDSSVSDSGVTTHGDVAISAFSKFGFGSAHFSAPGSYIWVMDDSVADLSTGAATIDCWVYPTSIAAIFPIFQSLTTNGSGDGFILYIDPNGGLAVYAREYFVINPVASVGVIQANKWTHIALTFDNPTMRVYVDGISIGQGNISTINAVRNTDRTFIGGDVYGHAAAGYIEDFRITRGAIRYSATFQPPAAPFTNTLRTFGQKNAVVYDHLTPV